MRITSASRGLELWLSWGHPGLGRLGIPPLHTMQQHTLIITCVYESDETHCTLLLLLLLRQQL